MGEIDQNKTGLTHRITALAAAYLDGIGCKPVETEVPVAPGWIADVASFAYPTPTEVKRAKLLHRVADTEIQTAHQYLFRHGTPLTVLVEVKVTKQDFEKDVERKFQQTPANLCYIAHPNSLDIWLDPRVNKWGRIVCSDDGSRILRVRGPWAQPQAPGDMVDFIASVAIRRDHRTSKAFLRDMLKSYRARLDREKKQRDLDNFIMFIAHLDGGDIVQCYESATGGKCSAWMRKKLELMASNLAEKRVVDSTN